MPGLRAAAPENLADGLGSSAPVLVAAAVAHGGRHSLEPQRFFGELPRGSVREALAFALCAELCAYGSALLLVAFGMWLCAPEPMRMLIGDPWACTTLALRLLAMIAWVLVIHVLWGVCLDWAAQRPVSRDRWEEALGLASRWQNGIRFGLYSCGWDLLTSRIGVLAALCTHGPRLIPVGAAARAPRRAQRAYLEYLGADRAGRRRALALSILALGGGTLVLLLIGVAELVFLARRFGD